MPDGVIGETLVCDICHREFIRTTHNQKYCSRACLKKSTSKKAEIKKTHKNNRMTLDDVCIYCKEHGITYAQYQTMNRKDF